MFVPLLIIAIVIFLVGVMLMFIGSDTNSGMFGISFIIMAVGIIMGVASLGVVVINAGEVGVTNVWGNVGNDPVQAGLHLVMPMVTDIIIFDAKTQVDTQTANVLSSDALTIATDTSINYRIDPAKAPMIYKTMGISYRETVVDPTMRSVIRDVFATYDTKSIYSSGRSNLSNEIKSRLDKDLTSRGIIIESVLLRSAEPPATVKASIEQKQQMEQEIQKKQFEVQKEMQEADRKRAEAQGIADANRIISNSITPEYISWYTVDMMKTHHSDAMMYIPTGSNGLPMVTNMPLSDYVRPAATPAA